MPNTGPNPVYIYIHIVQEIEFSPNSNWSSKSLIFVYIFDFGVCVYIYICTRNSKTFKGFLDPKKNILSLIAKILTSNQFGRLFLKSLFYLLVTQYIYIYVFYTYNQINHFCMIHVPFPVKIPIPPGPQPNSPNFTFQPIAMQRFFTFEGLWIVISTSSRDSFTFRGPGFRISEGAQIAWLFFVWPHKDWMPAKKKRTWKYI